MRAATDLMVEGGPSAVTVDAVVAHSGVARSTIYRHWSSRDELLSDVIEASVPRLPEPGPETDVVTALRIVMRYSATSMQTDWARMLPAFIMLRNHQEDIRAIFERIEVQSNKVLAGLIERAAEEGLIDADIDVPEAVAQLQGPLLMATLADLLPVDERYADAVVDRFLLSFPPSEEGPRPLARPAPRTAG
jgi:AcrR family transcriptional regulator